MHGRLKVKTPAEQQEAKKLERQKKISKYKEGMKQLIALRGSEDAEAIAVVMKLTGALLTANSDLYTVRGRGWTLVKSALHSVHLLEGSASPPRRS